MSTRAKVELIAGVLVLALLILAGKTWLTEHDDRLMLQATLKAKDEVLAQADKRISDRDNLLNKTLADYEDLRKQKLTPQQIIKEVPIAFPDLPKPIAQPLPDSPSVSIPKEDLQFFRDKYIQCQETSAKLSTCEQNQADAQLKVQTLTEEKDKAVAVVKGGTKMQRLVRSLKWIAIGGAVGYAAARASH